MAQSDDRERRLLVCLGKMAKLEADRMEVEMQIAAILDDGCRFPNKVANAVIHAVLDAADANEKDERLVLFRLRKKLLGLIPGKRLEPETEHEVSLRLRRASELQRKAYEAGNQVIESTLGYRRGKGPSPPNAIFDQLTDSATAAASAIVCGNPKNARRVLLRESKKLAALGRPKT